MILGITTSFMLKLFPARYTFNTGLLGSYDHNFKVPTIAELVKFDGVVIRDGVRGGRNGLLYRIWQYNGSDFDDEISNSINLGHWLQIKLAINLCNNKDAPKCGDKKYVPSHKCYFIYKAIVHNVNAITKRSDLEQSGDKTFWEHGGFGG